MRDCDVTVSRCHRLVEEHPALRTPGALRPRAVHLLLDRALRLAAWARLEFDRPRLSAALGPHAAADLMSGLPAHPAGSGPLSIADWSLDDDRRQLLRRILSFEDEGFAEPPLAFVERAVLRDARGRVILRASDGGEFFLFALPDEERAALLESYGAAGIPPEAVEEVPVNIEQGL